MQLGDIIGTGGNTAGYAVLKERVAAHPDRLYVVRGNHDDDANWNALGLPAQWQRVTPEAVLTGFDNSQDHIAPAAWDLIQRPVTDRYSLLFAHKSPTPFMLPDGSRTGHVMGESQSYPHREQLMAFLWTHATVFCVGHYHGFSFTKLPWGTVICEGRGGSVPDLSYTLLFIERDAITAHSVAVP